MALGWGMRRMVHKNTAPVPHYQFSSALQLLPLSSQPWAELHSLPLLKAPPLISHINAIYKAMSTSEVSHQKFLHFIIYEESLPFQHFYFKHLQCLNKVTLNYLVALGWGIKKIVHKNTPTVPHYLFSCVPAAPTSIPTTLSGTSFPVFSPSPLIAPPEESDFRDDVHVTGKSQRNNYLSFIYKKSPTFCNFCCTRATGDSVAFIQSCS